VSYSFKECVEMLQRESGATGMKPSPGGFVFGVEGYFPPPPVPTTITFFLDGSAMVCDQMGHPVRGSLIDGKTVLFAMTAPSAELQESFLPMKRRTIIVDRREVPLATHVEVVAALTKEGVDWTKLTWAGMPQLPYEQLCELPGLQTASIEQLRKIPDAALRKDALRFRREQDEARRKEIEAVQSE
jgi:hypothetical protein